MPFRRFARPFRQYGKGGKASSFRQHGVPGVRLSAPKRKQTDGGPFPDVGDRSAFPPMRPDCPERLPRARGKLPPKGTLFTLKEKADAIAVLKTGMYAKTSWKSVASVQRSNRRLLRCMGMSLMPFGPDTVTALVAALKKVRLSAMRLGGRSRTAFAALPAALARVSVVRGSSWSFYRAWTIRGFRGIPKAR